MIDNTRPVTTDNAPSGAQNHDVTVNLAATDNLSGVDVTEYSLDGGANWTTGPSVTVLASSGDGTTTITYRSRDLAGNVELAKSTSVTIDTTAPAGGVNDPGSVLHGTVSLTASPSDPDVASVQFLYRPAGPGAYTLDRHRYDSAVRRAVDHHRPVHPRRPLRPRDHRHRHGRQHDHGRALGEDDRQHRRPTAQP